MTSAPDYVESSTLGQSFNDLKVSMRLFGESYEPLRRLLYYNNIGTALVINNSDARDESSPDGWISNAPMFGSMPIDLRVNPFIIMKPSRGKNVIKYAAKRSLEEIGITVTDRAYCHPQHLIGKVLLPKRSRRIDPRNENGESSECSISEPIIKYGCLKSGLVCVDEASIMLKDPSYRDAIAYFKTALSDLGKNLLEKDAQDNPTGVMIRFYAKASTMIFCQPMEHHKELHTEGFLRRQLIVTIDVPNDDLINALHIAVEEAEDKTKDYVEIKDLAFRRYVEFLRKVKETSYKWSFEKGFWHEAEKIVLGYMKDIKATDSAKEMAADYMWDHTHMLAKLSCIIAVSNGRGDVRISDLKAASKDVDLFWGMTRDFIIEKLKLSSSVAEAMNRIVDRIEDRDDRDRILRAIDRKPGINISGICASIGKGNTSVNRLMDRIIADGLAVKVRSATDNQWQCYTAADYVKMSESVKNKT